MFERLGVASAIQLVDHLTHTDLTAADRLASVFERLLRLTDRQVVADVVAAAQAARPEPGGYEVFTRTAQELGQVYPDDPGVLAALLMNRIVLRPNEAIFLPAGNLHAYLRGGGVEVMANSDNVMRGGLTPKHIDVDELLSVLDFTPGFAGLIKPIEESRGLWRYLVPAPEFAVWRIDCDDTSVALPATAGARVLLVTEGALNLVAGEDLLVLVRGESAWLSASEAATVRGIGTAFIGGPGVF